MEQAVFWKIIEDAKAESSNQEEMLQCVEDQLSQLSASEIVDWVNLQAFYQGLADRDDVWEEGCRCNLYLSDDSFFYFRGWLLSQGEEVYSSVLRDPSVLSGYIKNTQHPYFEPFTSVGYDVYAQKAFEEEYGKDGEARFRKDWMAQHPDREYDVQWAKSGTYDIFSACKEQSLSEERKEALRQEIFDSSSVQEQGKSSAQEENKGYVLTDIFGDAFTVYPNLNMYVEPSNNLYLGLDYFDSDYGAMAPYGDITVNILPMAYLEATIDTNNNPQMLDFLSENGFGECTGRMVPSGFCQYPVFRFHEEKLKEIDPEGFAAYAKAHGKEKQPLDAQISHAERKCSASNSHLPEKTVEPEIE